MKIVISLVAILMSQFSLADIVTYLKNGRLYGVNETGGQIVSEYGVDVSSIKVSDTMVAFMKNGKLHVINDKGQEVVDEYNVTNFALKNSIVTYQKNSRLYAIHKTGKTLIDGEYGASLVGTSN